MCRVFSENVYGANFYMHMDFEVGETNYATNKGAIGEKMSSSYMSNPTFEMKVFP